MKSLEVIVRANITVKSSIKNLVLRDASMVVSYRVGLGRWGLLFSPSLMLLTPCSPDPSDGVLGPHGCGGERDPMVGHPAGCAGRATGAGAVGAAAMEGEAWEALALLGLYFLVRRAASCMHPHTPLVCSVTPLSAYPGGTKYFWRHFKDDIGIDLVLGIS